VGQQHIEELVLQKSLREAVTEAELTKHLACNDLRRSDSAQICVIGGEIRMVQEVPGCQDVMMQEGSILLFSTEDHRMFEALCKDC
jgi:site-specific recombinase XerC